MKEVEQVKKKVAIFDIDGTIFRSSLLIELSNALILEKIFPADAHRAYEQAYKKWHDRHGSYEEYIKAVVVAYYTHIKGVGQSDLDRVVKKVIEFNRDRVYRFTRDLVKELKEKGYYLLAISQSPKEIVDEFAKTLGFDETYGWLYEVGADGKYTGVGLHEDMITDKAKILKRFLEKEGLMIEGSVGVGDSDGDIPLMKMVESPICFNPNMKLYTAAKEHGWRVVVERKDVIYDL
jgi:HAD superfamily hydrolase (TIGR01490 family)